MDDVRAAEDGPVAGPASWVEGGRDIRSVDVGGSALQITYGHRSWHVPLERPVLTLVGRSSPARTIDARSGVVPYVDIGGRLGALSEWIGGSSPFAVAVLQGHGGAGKTRLAVELCRVAEARRWLTGLLRHSVDTLGLADLADTPAPRLVIVDGGENRRAQLEVVLPTLRLSASELYPVRVVVLVRSARGGLEGGLESLTSGRGADADTILETSSVFDLDGLMPTASESAELLRTVAIALRSGVGPAQRMSVEADIIPALNGEAPMRTTVTALLRARHRDDLLGPDLMEGLLRYEEESWGNVTNVHVDAGPTFRRRVVALAALAGARGENEAAHLFAALPELAQSSRFERQRIARWVHDLYPGPLWWNPMARGLLAEHLVASSLRDVPEALDAVLSRRRPENLVQPLVMLTRICADDPAFASTVRPVVISLQEQLRRQAAFQLAERDDVHALLSGTMLSDVLERSLSVIARPFDPSLSDIA
ncbi:hypothetical protein JF66_02750 [Cryobacterium sp. MLB-32]|uniref:hypothetical protein n=1 Tax=Cryobacterium sp. MLB-32 TaxID=1529318 RepID=UPI0004E61828|nr:hypothetical protein [Cryobacterium sp. MLB-32]KFF60654.1 hypothetical protein JF66_02750 [Cryobacterium sp. MLB-32]